MSPATTVLLASAAVLAVLLVAIRVWTRGWVEQGALEARSELDLVEARASTWRYRLNAWLRRTRLGHRLEVEADAAGVSLNALELLLVLVAVAAFGFVVLDAVLPRFLSILALVLAPRGIFVWLERRRSRRRDEFVTQLPELARVLSNATAAGRSLASAIRLAARELDEPAASEMRLVAEELRIGQSLDAALSRLDERMPSREVSVLVSTLLIQQRAGGDVVAALREMAVTLDGRQELHREVRTLMAGSVITGWITGGLGIASLLLIDLLSPGVLDQMAGSWLGRVTFLVSGTLYALGFTLIRRATRIEV